MARSTYEDFLIKEKIGSGSYGVVYKVIRKVDRLVYAMKEIDLQGMTRKEQEECIREVRVLSSLESDFIIKYYDSFLERGKLCIITEYAGNGNLHDYIKREKQCLPEDLIWKLYIQILLGLNHMHSKKILHRDIKTLNVFLDDNLNVKLGDMGVAKILSSNTNFAKTIVGTPYYLSPELCEDKPYNEKSDVWALGVVLYECCTKRHPFDADNQGALILKILRGKFPPVQGYSPEVTDIIKRCLTQSASRRPNTYKMLTLSCIRSHGDELGIVLPDVMSMNAFADKTFVKPRPPVVPPSEGSMDQPPLRTPVSSSSQVIMSNDDKAFVFGATLPRQQRSEQIDVSVSSVDTTIPLEQQSGEEPSAGEAGSEQPTWKVSDEQSQQALSAIERPRAWGEGSGSRQQEEQRLGNMTLADDEGFEDEERENIYDNPRAYRGADGEEDDEGEEGEGEEDEELQQEDQEAEHGYENGDEQFEGEDGEPGWAPPPNPVHMQHMTSALMIQRAACLDLIGDKAFDELYSLLKSNQVDEASMTDLSRLVFKIVPYEKSEVIQMMYRLLYLESQLE
ncbi:MAG: hypothetical protein WDW36_004898 [Sanguina aurantia]